jgi:hypothetical protein
MEDWQARRLTQEEAARPSRSWGTGSGLAVSTFHRFVAKGIYALLLTAFYPPLAEIANHWNAAMEIDVLYPA